MNCKDCKFWQGTKRTEWADCYRVIGHLMPELFSVWEVDNEGNMIRHFTVPFDPNTAPSWRFNPYFNDLYRFLTTKLVLPEGVRLNKEEGIYYFQTHSDFGCKRWLKRSESIYEYYTEINQSQGTE